MQYLIYIKDKRGQNQDDDKQQDQIQGQIVRCREVTEVETHRIVRANKLDVDKIRYQTLFLNITLDRIYKWEIFNTTQGLAVGGVDKVGVASITKGSHLNKL